MEEYVDGNNRAKEKRNKKYDLFPLIIGVVLILAGCFFLSDMRGSYKKTEAVIVEINEYYGIGSDADALQYDVFVNYEVDGKEYKHILLGSYDFTMKNGKVITIEYNTDKPGKIRMPYAAVAPYILFAAGGLFVAYEIITVAKSKKDEKSTLD